MFDDKTPLLKEIWKYLSDVKAKKWYTNTDISTRVGSTQWYISTIMNGKASVSIDKLREIAEVGLGIPPTTFDAKVQEITRRLVGAEPNDLDLASFLARDGLDEESIRKVQSFIDFVKMQK